MNTSIDSKVASTADATSSLAETGDILSFQLFTANRNYFTPEASTFDIILHYSQQLFKLQRVGEGVDASNATYWLNLADHTSYTLTRRDCVESIVCHDAQGSRICNEKDVNHLIHELKVLYNKSIVNLQKKSLVNTFTGENVPTFDQNTVSHKTIDEWNEKLRAVNTAAFILNDEQQISVDFSRNARESINQQMKQLIAWLEERTEKNSEQEFIAVKTCVSELSGTLPQLSFAVTSPLSTPGASAVPTDDPEAGSLSQLTTFSELFLKTSPILGNLDDTSRRVGSRIIQTHMVRYLRRAIDTKVSKVKNIESAIRQKRRELISIDSQFANEFIDDDAVAHLNKLVKAQKAVTNDYFRREPIAIKEQISFWNLFLQAATPAYKVVEDEKDMRLLEKIVEKERKQWIEYHSTAASKQRLLSHLEDIDEGVLLQKDKWRKYRLRHLKRLVTDIQLDDEEQEAVKWDDLETACAELNTEIEPLYEEFSDKQDKIYELGEQINQKVADIAASRREHDDNLLALREQLVDNIFRDVRGSRSGAMNENENVFHHSDCSQNECMYKKAVDISVNFAIREKDDNKSLTGEKILSYIKSLDTCCGFPHSSVKHKSDIQRIAKEVEDRYDEYTKKREKEFERFKRQLNRLEEELQYLRSNQATVANERDALRTQLATKEKDLLTVLEKYHRQLILIQKADQIRVVRTESKRIYEAAIDRLEKDEDKFDALTSRTESITTEIGRSEDLAAGGLDRLCNELETNLILFSMRWEHALYDTSVSLMLRTREEGEINNYCLEKLSFDEKNRLKTENDDCSSLHRNIDTSKFRKAGLINILHNHQNKLRQLISQRKLEALQHPEGLEVYIAMAHSRKEKFQKFRRDFFLKKLHEAPSCMACYVMGPQNWDVKFKPVTTKILATTMLELRAVDDCSRSHDNDLLSAKTRDCGCDIGTLASKIIENVCKEIKKAVTKGGFLEGKYCGVNSVKLSEDHQKLEVDFIGHDHVISIEVFFNGRINRHVLENHKPLIISILEMISTFLNNEWKDIEEAFDGFDTIIKNLHEEMNSALDAMKQQKKWTSTLTLIVSSDNHRNKHPEFDSVIDIKRFTGEDKVIVPHMSDAEISLEAFASSMVAPSSDPNLLKNDLHMLLRFGANEPREIDIENYLALIENPSKVDSLRALAIKFDKDYLLERINCFGAVREIAAEESTLIKERLAAGFLSFHCMRQQQFVTDLQSNINSINELWLQREAVHVNEFSAVCDIPSSLLKAMENLYRNQTESWKQKRDTAATAKEATNSCLQRTTKKSQVVTMDMIDRVLESVFSNALRMCLSGNGDTQHMWCDGECDIIITCNYGQAMDLLRNELRTILKDPENFVVMRQRRKLPNDTVDYLFIKLERSFSHSVQHHRVDLERICSDAVKALLAELEQEEKKMENETNMFRIRHQQWTAIADYCDVAVYELESRQELLSNMVEMHKAIIPTATTNQHVSEMTQELEEHHQSRLNDSFRKQVDLLIQILTFVKSKQLKSTNRSHKYYKMERSKFLDYKQDFLDSTWNVIATYLPNLNDFESRTFSLLIDEIKKLATARNADSEWKAGENPLFDMMAQLKRDVGGIFEILSKIRKGMKTIVEIKANEPSPTTSQSHHKRQSSVSATSVPSLHPFLPQRVFEIVIQREKESKRALVEQRKSDLHLELQELNDKKVAALKEDYSSLHFEKRLLGDCIYFIDKGNDIRSLISSSSSIDMGQHSGEHYYAFSIDQLRRYCKLRSEDAIGKVQEIASLQQTIDIFQKLKRESLSYQTLSVNLESELHEQENIFNRLVMIHWQQEMFKRGCFLCGFDAFSTGAVLNRLENFIGVIITFLLAGRSQKWDGCIYLSSSINELDEIVEKFVVKISKAALTLSADNCSQSDKDKFDWLARSVLLLINEEFADDHDGVPIVGQVVVTDAETSTLSIYTLDDLKIFSHLSISLLYSKNRYFFSLPVGKVEDVQRLSTLLTILFTQKEEEEELFASLCEYRLSDQLVKSSKGVLADAYKREIQTVESVKSINDFLAVICRPLTHYNVLVHYLDSWATLVELLNSPYEIVIAVKELKSFYRQRLFSIVRKEQAKRKKQKELQFLEMEKSELTAMSCVEDASFASDQLRDEILNLEADINGDRHLLATMHFEKHVANDRLRAEVEKVRMRRVTIKQRLQDIRLKLKKENTDMLLNADEAKTATYELASLQAGQVALDAQETALREKLASMQQDLDAINSKEHEVQQTLSETRAEKSRKEAEKAQKDIDIKASSALHKLLSNIHVNCAKKEVFDRRVDIMKELVIRRTLSHLLKFIQAEPLLMQDIEVEHWEAFMLRVSSEQPVAGMSILDIFTQIQLLFRNAFNLDAEITKELGADGKVIQRIKVRATNVSSSQLHEQVKNTVQQMLLPLGLNFSRRSKLVASNSFVGIESLHDPFPSLYFLIMDQVHCTFEHDYLGDDDPRLNATYSNAVQLIKDLNIDYLDVVASLVDEIEVIARNVLLENVTNFPGVDLSIRAQAVEIVGTEVKLDLSGRPGSSFVHQKAACGSIFRKDKKPNGDSGVDGHHGKNGQHGGNIVMIIEEPIQNLEALTLLCTNGGAAGVAQLGGDGDEGFKGRDGAQGKAPDTNGFGNGQTNIGWGKRGSPGGCGGAPGLTGCPGFAAKPGFIDIIHGGVKLLSESLPSCSWSTNNGAEGKCVLASIVNPNLVPKGNLLCCQATLLVAVVVLKIL